MCTSQKQVIVSYIHMLLLNGGGSNAGMYALRNVSKNSDREYTVPTVDDQWYQPHLCLKCILTATRPTALT